MISRRFDHYAARSVGRLLSPAGRRGRLAVFCYHEVAERSHSKQAEEPDGTEFARDVERIASVFTVLPLAEAARRMAAGTLPARSACITFDDGYADNHALGAPVLERAGVPATFFVTGGAVDEGIMWNDMVIEAVARRKGPLVFSAVPEFADTRLDGPALVSSLLGHLKYRPMEQRKRAAERFFRDNVDGKMPRLMMTRPMVADLARRGFDIGGHTMNHPILAELGDEQARQEIEGGSVWIEEVTGSRPRTFAYPNGKPNRDYSRRDAAMVAESGHELAVTTDWNLGGGTTDVYEIPRIGPWWREGRALSVGLLRLYAGHLLRGG